MPAIVRMGRAERKRPIGDLGLLARSVGPFGDTAREVLEVLPQLLQGKSKCKEALGCLGAQCPRQALFADGAKLGMVAIEHGGKGVRWWRRALRSERGRAGA